MHTLKYSHLILYISIVCILNFFVPNPTFSASIPATPVTTITTPSNVKMLQFIVNPDSTTCSEAANEELGEQTSWVILPTNASQVRDVIFYFHGTASVSSITADTACNENLQGCDIIASPDGQDTALVYLHRGRDDHNNWFKDTTAAENDCILEEVRNILSSAPVNISFGGVRQYIAGHSAGGKPVAEILQKTSTTFSAGIIFDGCYPGWCEELPEGKQVILYGKTGEDTLVRSTEAQTRLGSSATTIEVPYNHNEIPKKCFLDYTSTSQTGRCIDGGGSVVGQSNIPTADPQSLVQATRPQTNVSTHAISAEECATIPTTLSLSGAASGLADAAAGNNPASANESVLCAPVPRIKIPGLSFTSSTNLEKLVERDSQGEIVAYYIPFLGEYLSAIFRYAVALAGIVCIILIIISGIQWTLYGASPDNVDAAKERIQHAITGLILIVSSYTILYTIDPNLVEFKSLKVDVAKRIDIVGIFTYHADDRAVTTRTAGSTTPPSVDVPSETIEQILRAGNWSPQATGANGSEQIPWTTIQTIAQQNAGLFALLFGVGRWGISDAPADLADPANERWQGSDAGRGKHLMDYEVGGFGIAHYDSGALSDIYTRYGTPPNVPQSWIDAEDYNYMWCRGQGMSTGICSQRNASGERDETSWEHWKTWARSLLQRQDVQEYLIERWLADFYSDSLRACGGDVECALINARIRNSNPSSANAWAAFPIERQLELYEHEERHGAMMRAVVVYRYLRAHGSL